MTKILSRRIRQPMLTYPHTVSLMPTFTVESRIHIAAEGSAHESLSSVLRERIQHGEISQRQRIPLAWAKVAVPSVLIRAII
jgi:hypothetical protein